MEERITFRPTKQLSKSLASLCSATGRNQSDAIRHVLERGFERLRPQDFWSERRRDLSRLFRPVIDEFAEQAIRILGQTAKQIIDELHIGMAGLRDDFSSVVAAQQGLLESIRELEDQVEKVSATDPKLAQTVCEIRGFAHALLSEAKDRERARDNAIRSARVAGKRFGVEAFPQAEAPP